MAKKKKDVRVAKLPDEKERLEGAINQLKGAAHWSGNRLAGTEGECTCEPKDLRPEGDGPCNWCEQMIFAWDAVVRAAAALQPLVRENYRWGIDLDDHAIESAATSKTASKVGG